MALKPLYKRLQGEDKRDRLPAHVDDDVLPHEYSHLPMTANKIEEALADPGLTFANCDALYFSLLNGDAELFVQYSDAVLRAQADLVTGGKDE